MSVPEQGAEPTPIDWRRIPPRRVCPHQKGQISDRRYLNKYYWRIVCLKLDSFGFRGGVELPPPDPADGSRNETTLYNSSFVTRAQGTLLGSNCAIEADVDEFMAVSRQCHLNDFYRQRYCPGKFRLR